MNIAVAIQRPEGASRFILEKHCADDRANCPNIPNASRDVAAMSAESTETHALGAGTSLGEWRRRGIV
jgi:hypothetical protein